MLLIYKMVILGNNYLSYEKVHVFKNIFKWVKISIIYKISSSFFFFIYFFKLVTQNPLFKKNNNNNLNSCKKENFLI